MRGCLKTSAEPLHSNRKKFYSYYSSIHWKPETWWALHMAEAVLVNAPFTWNRKKIFVRGQECDPCLYWFHISCVSLTHTFVILLNWHSKYCLVICHRWQLPSFKIYQRNIKIWLLRSCWQGNKSIKKSNSVLTSNMSFIVTIE